MLSGMYREVNFAEGETDYPILLFTVAHKEQYTKVSAYWGYELLFFLECFYGGSVSLGLAKLSNSILEARLGGLHSARQARTVGGFPDVVGCPALPPPSWEGRRRFPLPLWGRKGCVMASDEVRDCSEEQDVFSWRKVPLTQVSRRCTTRDSSELYEERGIY